jgi:alpha-1,2-mannosyltransferase
VTAVVVLIAAVLAVGAAKGAARVTDDPVVWGLAGWAVPADFGVFLAAADAVRAGDSPYPEGELLGPPHAYYVYPPPLALAVTPLTWLTNGQAGAVWTLLGIAAVIGGLLLLGVRDWRCHAIALALAGTREALEYGAIGTFLVLLVGVAWHERNRLPASAAATGGAVVLKLFLWPLIVWHAAVGRVRTGAAAAGGAALLAIVTWAAISFHGLTEYPRVLRDLTDLEAEETYSVLALGTTLGLPRGAAQALSLLVGLALLLATVRAGRPRGDTADRRALILTLAAAFALTPILWHHYLVLLVVPVALASRRFSALWLVPAVGIVFEALGWYGGWADGIAPRVSVLGLIATVTAGALWATREEPAPDAATPQPDRPWARRALRASR